MHESDSKSKKGKDNKDDEPPAIWDHSRDMAIGGRLMDEKQRQRIFCDYRSLGDRFGSGKGGGFLWDLARSKKISSSSTFCKLHM